MAVETKARGKISKWGEILKIVKIFVMLFFLSSMFAGQAFADDHAKVEEIEKIMRPLRAQTETQAQDYYSAYAYVKSDWNCDVNESTGYFTCIPTCMCGCCGDKGCIPGVPKLTELNGSWITGEQILTRDGEEYILLENGDIIPWDMGFKMIYTPNSLIGGDANATHLRWADEPMGVPDADIPILKIIRASIFGALISLVVCVWLYWRR